MAAQRPAFVQRSFGLCTLQANRCALFEAQVLCRLSAKGDVTAMEVARLMTMQAEMSRRCDTKCYERVITSLHWPSSRGRNAVSFVVNPQMIRGALVPPNMVHKAADDHGRTGRSDIVTTNCDFDFFNC